MSTISDATLSDDGTYRYTLSRTWDQRNPPLVWIMLNPSTADATEDDPTIRRCLGFTRREERYGGLVVVNLYALRATNPKALHAHFDPVGPLGNSVLADHAAQGWDLVAAWGANSPNRARRVVAGPLLSARLWCLGKTKGGHPRHPLYVKGDQPFEVYR